MTWQQRARALATMALTRIFLESGLWTSADSMMTKFYVIYMYVVTYIEGILPKGPYLPCVSMAGRALLAGYHRYMGQALAGFTLCECQISLK